MLGNKSAPGSASSPAQQKPGGLSPAGGRPAAAQSVSVADFQSVVDEAAIIFASGDAKSASSMLVEFLSKTKGNADKRVWYMLLDIYHAIGQKEAFDQLAIHFANRFGSSPPSWDTLGGGGGDSAPSAAGSASAPASGGNVLIVEGGATGVHLAGKCKDFIAASKTAKTCKIDVSRMKGDASDAEGLGLLQSTMAQMRKYKVAATLMGENSLANWLKKAVEESKESKNPSFSAHWLLLLEILQWRGMESEFEDLSFEYTVTFEVSGPGWETEGVMTIEAVAEAPEQEDTGSASDRIVPDPLITDMSIQKIKEVLKAAIKEKGEAHIDFSNVKRMEFSSAGTFLGIVMEMNVNPGKIVLDSPSELIVALLDVVGLSPFVSISPRKR